MKFQRISTTLSWVTLIGAIGCGADADFAEPEAARFGLHGEHGDPGDECLVSDHDVEHACLHVEHGPFASVAAQPYPGFVSSNINQPHTAYTVTLPDSGGTYQGGVLYFPAATGEYAFFLAPGVPLAIYDAQNEQLSPEAEGPIDPELCAGIDTAHVYALSQGQFYTVVLGPAADEDVMVIVEYLGEHRECEDCEEIHLTASKTLWPPSQEDGNVTLSHPVTFEIPATVPVVEGTSSGGLVTLRFSSGGGPTVRCRYWGSFSNPDRFDFLHCNNGLHPGDDAEADSLRLRVNLGGLGSLTTSVELELEDEECHDDHGHDHDDHDHD